MQKETEYQKEYREVMKKRFNINVRNKNTTHGERICSACNKTLQLTSDNFRYSNKEGNKFQYICKKCARIKQKESIENNPDTLKNYRDTTKYKYSQLKSQYKKKNIKLPFSLEEYEKDFVNKGCEYCGKDNESSVFVGENEAMPCCKKCKKIRSLLSHEQMLKIG